MSPHVFSNETDLSLNFITDQLNAPYGISQRFHCLYIDKQTKIRCRASAEYFMFYRPGMSQQTWAALKVENVTARPFTDIIRCMFCGYHDVSASYNEKQREFFKDMWRKTGLDERRAFLEAVQRGLRDIHEDKHRKNNVTPHDIDVTLGSSSDAHEVYGESQKEQSLIIYQPHKTSLDIIREMLKLDSISPDDPVEPRIYATDVPADADEDSFGAPSFESMQPIPPISPKLEGKGPEPNDDIAYQVKIESSDSEASVGELETPSRRPSHDSREGNPASSNTPLNIEGDIFKHAAFEYQEKKDSLLRAIEQRSATRSASLRSNDSTENQTIPVKQVPCLFGPNTTSGAGTSSTENSTNTSNLPIRNGSPFIPQIDFTFTPNAQSKGRATTSSENHPASSPTSRFPSPSPHISPSRSAHIPSTPTPKPAPRSPQTPSKSPTSPLYRSQTLDQTASNIRNILRKPIDEDNKGTIYILQAPDFFSTFAPATSLKETWLKIGISRDVPKRIASLKAQCGLFDLTEIRDADNVPFSEPLPMEQLRRIERLCHEHLNNFRRRMDCSHSSGTSCDVVHNEWFAVGEDLAKQTVRLWVRFMAQRPYTEWGLLGEFWGHRIMKTEYLRLKKSDGGDVGVAAWGKWLEEGAEAMSNREDGR